MSSLNGKLNDSFIAIMPLDDGNIIVQRIYYSDVDFLKECPPSQEVSTEEGTLNGFCRELVKVVIRYIGKRFGCEKEWVRDVPRKTT